MFQCKRRKAKKKFISYYYNERLLLLKIVFYWQLVGPIMFILNLKKEVNHDGRTGREDNNSKSELLF